MEGEAEKTLIAQAKQGDLSAFEALILRHEKIVYNVALRMMGQPEDAKDISQEVFLKVYKSIGAFDERSAFSTWLYRITMNTCIDEMRRRKGKQSYSLEEELEGEDGGMQRQIADTGETPEESLLRAERKAELLQAMQALSAEHRAAIVLRDIRGLGYDEIAAALGLPLGTVKSRISRARIQLKEEVLKIRERNGGGVRHKNGKEGRR